MSTTKLRAIQVLLASGKNLETALGDLEVVYNATDKSVTLPDGTVIKWGTIAATAQIAANAVSTITVVFPTPFETECEFFDALLQPAVSTDFYGITSLVAITKNQIQFTVRNGATAQAVAGGLWFAFGR